MKKNKTIVAAVLTLSLILSATSAFAETTPTDKAAPDTKTSTTTGSAITTPTTGGAVTTSTPAIEVTPAAISTPPAVKAETMTADVSLNSLNIKVNDTVVAVTGESYTLEDGTKVPFSILYKGTTYLPMRKVGELVGKEISYDGTTKTASINSTTAAVKAPVASTATAVAGSKASVTFSVNSINITVDSKDAAKVGESYTLTDGSQVPFSLLYNGTTYLPMRKVGELVGKDIEYVGATKTAQIKDKGTTPETPVDKAAAYKDNANVPDFGAATKAKLIKTETVDGLVVYSYEASELTDANGGKAKLAAYDTAVTAYGYEVVKDAKLPAYITTGKACTNKTTKTTLYVGSTEDAKTKTTTWYVAIEQAK